MMLYGRQERRSEHEDEPIFSSFEMGKDLPKTRFLKESVDARIAYQLVMDELLDEGQPRQNLATFCQTFMEDEAIDLMSKTLAKNAIDKSEYPRTADIENRCVQMIANLWHAPKEEKFLGTSTVGSSEACMLAGMAMKFRWRKFAEPLGLDIHKPNLVISSGYQVCWEKFCVYWDIELRQVPMTPENLKLDIEQLADYVDDYTIGIVGILGITYTGAYDDLFALNDWVENYNQTAKIKQVIHVDGASGALYAPFVEPELEWDFRLKNVVSINTSGHKYGLVYPGIGWLIWRDKKYLPNELIFEVSYLGGTMPTININFSRSASQVIGQYYNFVRFGFDGYKKTHENTHHIAQFLAQMLRKTNYFELVNAGDGLPVICYKLKKPVKWTLYDLSDRLQMKGWQVPTYPLPANVETTIVQRYVVKSDFSRGLAVEFVEDLKEAIHFLEEKATVLQKQETNKVQGFTH